MKRIKRLNYNILNSLLYISSSDVITLYENLQICIFNAIDVFYYTLYIYINNYKLFILIYKRKIILYIFSQFYNF